MANMALSLDGFLGADWESWVITAGRIVLILVVAFILSRIVRRVVRRLAARLAKRHERKRVERSKGVDRGIDDVLRTRLLGTLSPAEKQERAAQRARTLGVTIASICSVVIYAVAIMVCLAELGVSLAPILASAGIAGVALGFGAQSLVRDFLSGIFIIIEDQYGVGDVVDVGEAVGTVEEVTLRTTTLRGLDGTLWHVPNGEIRRAGNSSQYWARVILDVPVTYDADLVAVSALIKQAADSVWRSCEGGEILDEPEVWGVEDFGADSVAIRLAVRTLPGSQWMVARRLRAQVKEAFDREGFEIPFPQRTVWLRESPQKSRSSNVVPIEGDEPPAD